VLGERRELLGQQSAELVLQAALVLEQLLACRGELALLRADLRCLLPQAPFSLEQAGQRRPVLPNLVELRHAPDPTADLQGFPARRSRRDRG
jgi:hypothetical protein